MKFSELDRSEFKKIFPISENKELALKYNVAESTIRMWAAKLKVKKKGCGWTRQDENYILTYYGGKKYSILQIAEKLGRTRWAIINKYRELSGFRAK